MQVNFRGNSTSPDEVGVPALRAAHNQQRRLRARETVHGKVVRCNNVVAPVYYLSASEPSGPSKAKKPLVVLEAVELFPKHGSWLGKEQNSQCESS